MIGVPFKVRVRGIVSTGALGRTKENFVVNCGKGPGKVVLIGLSMKMPILKG